MSITITQPAEEIILRYWDGTGHGAGWRRTFYGGDILDGISEKLPYS
ncbi:hypothetical protein ACNKHM_05200 [Shigella sonnei]